jgi:hypothetical protein
MPRVTKLSRRISDALAAAGIDAKIVGLETLAIGTAGLNIRGPRDEDGTHTRVRLHGGGSVIYREYAPTGMTEIYVSKEAAVFDLLRGGGVPAPEVLGRRTAEGGPSALVLSDGGGDPLEAVFREIDVGERGALWAAVGATVRGLHDIDVADAGFLRAPVLQRPWTRPIPYFVKSLRRVHGVRPDLDPAVADLLDLRRPLQEWIDSRRQVVCFGRGGYAIPGLMVERAGRGWACRSWLSLGYYVWISDPDLDLVAVNLGHREWTGDDLPDSFFDS